MTCPTCEKCDKKTDYYRSYCSTLCCTVLYCTMVSTSSIAPNAAHLHTTPCTRCFGSSLNATQRGKCSTPHPNRPVDAHHIFIYHTPEGAFCINPGLSLLKKNFFLLLVYSVDLFCFFFYCPSLQRVFRFCLVSGTSIIWPWPDPWRGSVQVQTAAENAAVRQSMP